MIARQPTPSAAIEAEILSRLRLPPLSSEEAAKALLSLEFSAADVKRMKKLSGKARRGALTQADEQLADAYERIGSLLAVLKSKTRISLRGKARAPKR